MRSEKDGDGRGDVGYSQVFLDATHDMAALVGFRGEVLAVNAATAASLGLAPEEVIGRCVWDLVPGCNPMDHRKRLLEGVFRSGKHVEFEDARNGRTFHTRAFPVFDRRGRVVQVACFAQDITARKEANDSLGRKNTALAELLSIADTHKNELAHSVMENIQKLILPLVDDMKRSLSGQDREKLDLLADRLREIASPFAARLSRQFTGLSPTEIRICDLIRRGMSTNEVAEREHVAPATVGKHREHIRQKLGIRGKGINLVCHLDAMFSESAGK